MSYNLLKPVKLIVGGDMGGNLSAIQPISLQDNVGIQLRWTGTPTGAFSFLISMDHLQDAEGNVLVAGHWVAIPLSPPIAAAGSADDAYVDLNQISASYLKVVYTRSAGSGSLDALVMAKGV
jgi:hypothetical protein